MIKKLLIVGLFLVFRVQAECILVTGGAGYIGSATVIELINQGKQVLVIDKRLPKSSFFSDSQKVVELSTIESLTFSNELGAPQVIFIQSDFADTYVLEKLARRFAISTVIHFAGFIEAGKSVNEPAPFYDNNVIKTIRLLDGLRTVGITQIIFSSSAAVYGTPVMRPINESHPCNPESPYGKTKYIIDMVLEDYTHAYDMKAISLRYFNASGAIPEHDIMWNQESVTHVIPLLLGAACSGKPFYIFGTDYPTPDKTSIRDYIHIKDLAIAHCKAVEYITTHECGHEAINLGTGRGYSVKELIASAERVTGLAIDVRPIERRAGDPDWVVADPSKAEKLLGWKACYSSIDNIIGTAYQAIANMKKMYKS